QVVDQAGLYCQSQGVIATLSSEQFSLLYHRRKGQTSK
ncbi:MAG: hypothetical protein ACI93V_001481, partial [Alteromonadaceae bacterium]